MCGRVHFSARRWHVAWRLTRSCVVRELMLAADSFEGFEKWLLRSGSLASHRSFRNCRTKRETAPAKDLRKRASCSV
jgi:hypothetical protein